MRTTKSSFGPFDCPQNVDGEARSGSHLRAQESGFDDVDPEDKANAGSTEGNWR